MRISVINVIKPGNSHCAHDYIYSSEVLLSDPVIYVRICRYCGQVEHVTEEIRREPTYDELHRKFHGQEVKQMGGEDMSLNLINLKEETWYLIDWDKVQTMDDMRFILSRLGLGISSQHAQFEQLKPFLQTDCLPPEESLMRTMKSRWLP